MGKKKISLYEELHLRAQILTSESNIMLYLSELVMAMGIIQIPEKTMRRYLAELEEKGWNDTVIKEILRDIKKELNRNPPWGLNDFKQIGGWMETIKTSLNYYHDLLKEAEKKIPNWGKR